METKIAKTFRELNDAYESGNRFAEIDDDIGIILMEKGLVAGSHGIKGYCLTGDGLLMADNILRDMEKANSLVLIAGTLKKIADGKSTQNEWVMIE